MMEDKKHSDDITHEGYMMKQGKRKYFVVNKSIGALCECDSEVFIDRRLPLYLCEIKSMAVIGCDLHLRLADKTHVLVCPTGQEAQDWCQAMTIKKSNIKVDTMPRKSTLGFISSAFKSTRIRSKGVADLSYFNLLGGKTESNRVVSVKDMKERQPMRDAISSIKHRIISTTGNMSAKFKSKNVADLSYFNLLGGKTSSKKVQVKDVSIRESQELKRVSAIRARFEEQKIPMDSFRESAPEEITHPESFVNRFTRTRKSIMHKAESLVRKNSSKMAHRLLSMRKTSSPILLANLRNSENSSHVSMREVPLHRMDYQESKRRSSDRKNVWLSEEQNNSDYSANSENPVFEAPLKQQSIRERYVEKEKAKIKSRKDSKSSSTETQSSIRERYHKKEQTKLKSSRPDVKESNQESKQHSKPKSNMSEDKGSIQESTTQEIKSETNESKRKSSRTRSNHEGSKFKHQTSDLKSKRENSNRSKSDVKSSVKDRVAHLKLGGEKIIRMKAESKQPEDCPHEEFSQTTIERKKSLTDKIARQASVGGFYTTGASIRELASEVAEHKKGFNERYEERLKRRVGNSQ